MGVWLKSKRGIKRLRDTAATDNATRRNDPMRVVTTDKPTWFDSLYPEQFQDDADLVVVHDPPPPDAKPNERRSVTREPGTPADVRRAENTNKTEEEKAAEQGLAYDALKPREQSTTLNPPGVIAQTAAASELNPGVPKDDDKSPDEKDAERKRTQKQISTDAERREAAARNAAGTTDLKPTVDNAEGMTSSSTTSSTPETSKRGSGIFHRKG